MNIQSFNEEYENFATNKINNQTQYKLSQQTTHHPDENAPFLR